MEGKQIYGMTYYPAEGQMMFNVKADENGIAFVKQLRKALNRDRYTIRVRGSLSNRSGLRASGKYYDQSTPLAVSDRWRVYIDTRVVERNSYVANVMQSQAQQLTRLKAEVASLSVAEQQAKHMVTELTKIADSRLAIMEQNRATAEKQRQKILELEDCISNWQTYYDEAENDKKDLRAVIQQWKNSCELQREQIIEMRKRLSDLTYHGASQADIDLCERWKDTNLIKMARSVFDMNKDKKLMVLKAFKEGSGLGLKEAKTVCDYLVFK